MVMKCQYVCDHYGVPADIGRAVTVYGQPGVIAADRGNYIGVNFDSDKPGVIKNCHPTDKVEYGEMVGVRVQKLTRSQKNYQRFLDTDPGMPFAEWMGFRRRA